MKQTKSLPMAAILLACAGMLIPPSVVRAATTTAPSSPSAPAGAVVDIALREGGALAGQVLDAQGNHLASTTVAIQSLDGLVVTAVTDPAGRFEVTGLRGGTYRIATAHGAGTYRLWAPTTAPPSARPGVLLVAGDQQVLGQWGCYSHDRPVLRFLSNPWVIAGLVAAAIAIPVAIHNSRDRDDGPTSP